MACFLPHSRKQVTYNPLFMTCTVLFISCFPCFPSSQRVSIRLKEKETPDGWNLKAGMSKKILCTAPHPSYKHIIPVFPFPPAVMRSKILHTPSHLYYSSVRNVNKAKHAAAQEGESLFEVPRLQSSGSVWETPRRTKTVSLLNLDFPVVAGLCN